jgi:multiple sugar transport system permease protein
VASVSSESNTLAVELGARSRSHPPGRRLQRSEVAWALAFLLPYLAVFAAFVVYPVGYGIWMAREPALYDELIADPAFLRSLVNTVLFVGFGVNVMMFAAVLLSGFFMRREWWVRILLAIYLLSWALPAIPSFVSFHWMLIGEQGLIDSLIRELFGVDGPIWFNDQGLAIAWNVAAYVWKWMPFWTMVFLAGRMAIPQEIYEAAAIDGAGGASRFVHVVFPLLANVYLVCTLLATLWTVGDFNTVYLVSMGAPARSSEVLATLGFHYAFDAAQPALGVAAVMTALPLLVPLTLVLMRRLQVSEVEL